MKRLIIAAIMLLLPLFVAGAQGLGPVNMNSETYSQNADNSGYMTRKGGRLFLNGDVIKAKDAKAIFGEELYNETYRGSITQIRVANNLTAFGLIGIVGGLTGSLVASFIQDEELEKDFDMRDYDKIDACDVIIGSAVTAALAGFVCINVAVPFGSIGKSRLSWLADDYNQGGRYSATLNIGLQKHGYGLALNF